MGYRSEVVLAVHKQVMGKFLQLIGQNDEMKTMCFSHAEVTENYNGDGNFLFRWSGIKWYDSFPEDRQPTGSEFFKFVRVGEEQDDIVNDGYCEDFEIHTCTSIEVY